MNNLHITLNEFRHASRVIKETNTILCSTEVEKVYVSALLGHGLHASENIKGVMINRFSLVSREWNKSFLVQALKFLEYSVKVIFFYRDKNIRLINIHALSLLPLGFLLKLLYGAKLVYDAHELETEMNGLKGFRQSVAKVIERIFIRGVDLTIVVSPSIADWYERKYSIPRPTVVLNSPRLHELSYSNVLKENLSIAESKKIVLYQGGLSQGRGIEKLLSAFSSTKDESVVIVFMGYGPLETVIKEHSKKYNNIFLHHAVQPDELLEYTSSADIGISFIENTCLSYYYCLPNKLFEYAMAGLPIIASNMKEMSQLITTYNMGIVVDELSEQSLSKAIIDLRRVDLGLMKVNARRAAEDHCWENQEVVMLNAYRKLGLEILD